MKKVYVVGGGVNVGLAFRNAGFQLVDAIDNADVVCFTGGEDVDPAMYGEANVHSYINRMRDAEEIKIFDAVKEKGTVMVGICRGGQLLNVLSGGKMWQDVDNHGIGGTHEINCSYTGEIYQVSSTHHQMMRPSDAGNVLATCSRSTYKQDEVGVHVMGKDDRDVEVVFYPETKSLCFQPHPEFFGPGHECFDYFFRLISDILSGKLK